MMFARMKKDGVDVDEEKPVGPRVSQVSEEARRLGEVVSVVQWLASVIIAASPKFKTGKIGSAEPYPSPVMIDGNTGEYIGKKTDSQRRRSHLKRVDIAKEAAARYSEVYGDKN